MQISSIEDIIDILQIPRIEFLNIWKTRIWISSLLIPLKSSGNKTRDTDISVFGNIFDSKWF